MRANILTRARPAREKFAKNLHKKFCMQNFCKITSYFQSFWVPAKFLQNKNFAKILQNFCKIGFAGTPFLKRSEQVRSGPALLPAFETHGARRVSQSRLGCFFRGENF